MLVCRHWFRLFVHKIKSLIILTLCYSLYMCKITLYLQGLVKRDKFTGLPLHALSQKIKNVLQFIYIEQYKVFCFEKYQLRQSTLYSSKTQPNENNCHFMSFLLFKITKILFLIQRVFQIKVFEQSCGFEKP